MVDNEVHDDGWLDSLMEYKVLIAGRMSLFFMRVQQYKNIMKEAIMTITQQTNNIITGR